MMSFPHYEGSVQRYGEEGACKGMEKTKRVVRVTKPATKRLPKRVPYWLVVRDGCDRVEVLTIRALDGLQALPVFSFEEEAEMFLHLRGSRDGWRLRETGTGELLSMLYTILRDVRYVTLDPIPENSGLNGSGLLSISREAFVKRLDAINGRDDLVKSEGTVPSIFDKDQPIERTVNRNIDPGYMVRSR
jgi:hypothetical protein